MDIEEIFSKVRGLLEEKERVLVAIDGRCAAGKTTLAARLQEVFACNVFHMDDFFLRPEQRTKERYAEPGGNVDRERFEAEVLRPLLSHKPFSYRPFDCRTMALQAPVEVNPTALSVIEGTYSCHPALFGSYDLRIFLTVTPKEQLLRIRRRNAEGVEMFTKRWIPLEEHYFAAYQIEERCEMHFETSSTT